MGLTVGIVVSLAGIAGLVIWLKKKMHWSFIAFPIMAIVFGLGVIAREVLYDSIVTDTIVVVVFIVGLTTWLLWYLIIPLYNKVRYKGTFFVDLMLPVWKKGDILTYTMNGVKREIKIVSKSENIGPNLYRYRVRGIKIKFFTADEKGYKAAVQYLKDKDKYKYFMTNKTSTDGYSLVYFANSILERELEGLLPNEK